METDAARLEQGETSSPARQRQRDGKTSAIPADVWFVISALNGEHGAKHERRRFVRYPFVMAGELEVLGDAAPPRRTVYTRDTNRWGVGFVTQHALPVGRDATLRIWIGGEMLMLRACILRCREALPGWSEGAALLYSEEPRLEMRKE